MYMHIVCCGFILVLCNVSAFGGGGGGGAGGGVGEPCQPDKLTVYKVVLHTYWSRDKFPKHYPDWRPPAQWSKLFGRSHDKSFQLFRLGQQSSAGIKVFAETGRSDLLEEQTQGESGIYDEFNAPPIQSGVGRTEAEFFVDGNHSHVSLISRIVPSPDWFIGIDNFDLCVNGNWLDSITIEVDPIDAGTDNGFTFTAPNWPTDPQGIAYRITSRYPAHPAGSFFYPHMKRLPAIATFQFIKVKEYELSEVFHHDEDDQHYEVVKMEHLGKNFYDGGGGSNGDIELEIEEERKEQEQQQQQQQQRLPSHHHHNTHQLFETSLTTTVTSPPLPPYSPSLHHIDDDQNRLPNTINYDVLGVTSSSSSSSSTSSSTSGKQQLSGGGGGVVALGDKNAIMNSIVDSYRTTHIKDPHHRKKYRKTRPPRDCRVSDWSAWSACSKSCGIGEMQRRREVLKHARRGGRLCPPLVETKWCGSARSCNKGYFNW